MLLEQIKALSNDTRMQVMEWLKQPRGNFPHQDHEDPEGVGICMSHIQQKAELSASTASTHLAILQRAGFLTATRIGKWTYFRRNEKVIQSFAQRLQKDL